ncbi:cardiolipin synthase [Aureibacillus halotolerans]|uniref:Cardiolipin synthase n=1 Tax=Aureibacillus halotolerans TaxID=1508390 RepID=A0A4R6U520_9BACI|nr:cardiolipin synthase [Aureibacillus halotolerans]TDQ40826.1 cardiolipin synthetase 2 [Aureibacillus halotolerans]
MSVSAILIYLLIALNFAFAIIVVFRERRDIGATWAWLLVMFFLPGIGFITYLLFAQNLSRYHLFDSEDFNRRDYDQMAEKQLEAIHAGSFPYHNPETFEHSDLLYLHLLNNKAVFTDDNKVELYADGNAKFTQLLTDIKAAKDTIHLQYYIFRNDQLGRDIIRALTEKATEGVEVKVLYDDLGSRTLRKRNFKDLVAHGGEIEAFFPSKFRIINIRLNYRNHRKIVVIDGKIGYIGGFNVGDEYLGRSEKFGYWRDNHLRIQGKAVYSLQARFILDWNQASKHHDISYEKRLFPQVETTGETGIQIVTSGPDSELEHIKYGYLKMISTAQKSIYIQSPYFIPDASVLDALRVACLSDIEVTIMIPNKPDHMFVYWATMSYIGELLKTGAKVYIYNKGFIHAKTIIVDDEISSVGTANIDVRSFKLNFEVNAFLYDKEIAMEISEKFREDIEVSTLLTYDAYEERSRWIRFKESISRLLSPIL